MNELMRRFMIEVSVFNLEPAETICFSLYGDGSMIVQLTEDGFRRCMVGRRLIFSGIREDAHHIKFIAGGNLEFVTIIETDEMKEFIASERQRQRQENEVTF